MDVSTGGGDVTIDRKKQDNLPFIQTYPEGSIVTIEAVPSLGYVFTAWEGDIASTQNPERLVIDCSRKVTARFAVDWRLISIFAGGIIFIAMFIAVSITWRPGSGKEPAEHNEESAPGSGATTTD
ncbi:MAG: hypothetical protein GX631_09130 [Dehalococcoidales bacterium]|nr:hypothetical protein [Dehalococcoidales bacterium]